MTTAVREANDYPDGDDREQRLAELDAGRSLLDAPLVRVEALREVLVKGLKYLAGKFVESAIGIAATAALGLLATLFTLAL